MNIYLWIGLITWFLGCMHAIFWWTYTHNSSESMVVFIINAVVGLACVMTIMLPPLKEIGNIIKHAVLIVLISTALVMNLILGCYVYPLKKECNNPRYYKNVVQRTGYDKYFPAQIPKDAVQVKFHYAPAGRKPNAIMSLNYRYPTKLDMAYFNTKYASYPRVKGYVDNDAVILDDRFITFNLCHGVKKAKCGLSIHRKARRIIYWMDQTK